MISRVVSTGMVGQVLGLLHDIILQASQHIGDSTAKSAQLVQGQVLDRLYYVNPAGGQHSMVRMQEGLA